MRAVISVSVDPQLAADLHAEAEARGRTFSEHTRRLIELGRAVQNVADLAAMGLEADR